MNMTRFTDDARQTFQRADTEAFKLSHKHLGAEHLLLAMLRSRDSWAVRFLESQGFVPEQAVVNLLQLIPKGKTSAKFGVERPQTLALGWIIEQAIGEARLRGHNWIGSEHLLLALAKRFCGLIGDEADLILPSVMKAYFSDMEKLITFLFGPGMSANDIRKEKIHTETLKQGEGPPLIKDDPQVKEDCLGWSTVGEKQVKFAPWGTPLIYTDGAIPNDLENCEALRKAIMETAAPLTQTANYARSREVWRQIVVLAQRIDWDAFKELTDLLKEAGNGEA